MVKVEFRFDKEKDLWNHWHKSNWKSPWANFQIHPKIKKICKGKKLEECKQELSKHLSKLQDSKLIEINLKSTEKAWKTIEKEFFERMDRLMNKKFDKDIFAYLTTTGICPYDPNEPSFMFSLFYSLPTILQTCGHEIMHLYFHKFYWKKIEEKIGKEKTADLKEALTVLLNLEFKDLWFVEDLGYNSHKKIRDFILKTWLEEKDFDSLLEKCVDFMK